MADGVWAGGTLSAAWVPSHARSLGDRLTIGAGTKPLHDLITNLQAAKYNKKDPRPLQ